MSKKNPLWLRDYYIRIRSYGIPRRWGIFTHTRHWDFPTWHHALYGLQQISDLGEKEFLKAESAEMVIEKVMGSEYDPFYFSDRRSYHHRVV